MMAVTLDDATRFSVAAHAVPQARRLYRRPDLWQRRCVAVRWPLEDTGQALERAVTVNACNWIARGETDRRSSRPLISTFLCVGRGLGRRTTTVAAQDYCAQESNKRTYEIW